jgi:hypothetical protein
MYYKFLLAGYSENNPQKRNSYEEIIFISNLTLIIGAVYAQNYPEPELSNEVYYYNRDAGNRLVRLEKAISKMNSKTGMIKGSEVSYSIDGTHSSVRLNGRSDLSFIISTGSSSSGAPSKSDSIMSANGMDPLMLKGLTGMNAPSRSITLYKVDIEKGERKVLLQKSPGMNPFGKHQIQSSDKYTFSAKKIKDGYWELVIDKSLPEGEYAFSMSQMGMSGMGDALLFAFGID